MNRDRAELAAFLRSRRDRLTPERAGIEPFPGPRRVPGLRREELAVAAGVSADYYTRVEQGRQPVVSAEVLDALARALRLDEVERAHLHDLAAPPARRGAVRQMPDAGLLRVMTALDHRPVLLLGPHGAVLAANTLLRAVLGRALTGNFFDYLFRDPLAKERIVNWADFAAAAVGALRREAARHPDDRRLRSMIAALRREPEVARRWADHEVSDWTPGPKQISHPEAGTLLFDIEILTAPQAGDQRLVVYTAEAGSPTERLLPLLASWSLRPATYPELDLPARGSGR